MSDPKHKIGDWLRWQRNGVLVIGEVQYVRDRWPSLDKPEYITDAGSVSEDRVLESRPSTLSDTPHEHR